MATYVVKMGNRRADGKFILDWKDGKSWAEGETVTSEDLDFVLRERQLETLRWLERVVPGEDEEDDGEEGEGAEETTTPRRRGRRARRRKSA